MALAHARIPHITYVEEIDVTALEELRAALNKQKRADQPKLTVLPFLMRAMVKAIAEQPSVNALFDDEAGVLHRHGGVHIGIAAQTPAGLIVPVVEHTPRRAISGTARPSSPGSPKPRATGAATRDELIGLDHHDHLARRAGRRRDDADHQSSRGRDRRRQQDHDAAGLGRLGLRSAQDDEPLVELRPSRDRRLGRGGLRAAASRRCWRRRR